MVDDIIIEAILYGYLVTYGHIKMYCKTDKDLLLCIEKVIKGEPACPQY